MGEIVTAFLRDGQDAVRASVQDEPTDRVWFLAEQFETIMTTLKYEVETRD
jgi:hypothetical protein